jgi:tRNA-modifying protein YgfZ
MKVLLKERALLRISGSDCESFLQNQLSNDITKLDKSSVQVNAYCQHQGKIIGLFWVVCYENSFMISFPQDILEKVESRLKMFVIMSDVIIEDISESYSQIGLIDENQSNALRINDKLSILIEAKDNHYDSIMNNNHEWAKACIDAYLPEVFAITSEKFVPQMLNLDIDEIGVSFSKGCYPGQEVVARLHYLGSAKRRLFSFRSNQEMLVGDSLYCASSKTALARGDRYKGSGIVISKVKYNALFYCLATLDVDLINEEITLNNQFGPILERINDE